MKIFIVIYVIFTFTKGYVVLDKTLIEKFLRAGLKRAAIAMRTDEKPLWQLDPVLYENLTYDVSNLGYSRLYFLSIYISHKYISKYISTYIHSRLKIN